MKGQLPAEAGDLVRHALADGGLSIEGGVGIRGHWLAAEETAHDLTLDVTEPSNLLAEVCRRASEQRGTRQTVRPAGDIVERPARAPETSRSPRTTVSKWATGLTLSTLATSCGGNRPRCRPPLR